MILALGVEGLKEKRGEVGGVEGFELAGGLRESQIGAEEVLVASGPVGLAVGCADAIRRHVEPPFFLEEGEEDEAA